jgi:hypothetical protein
VFPFVEQGPRTAVVEAAVDNAARRFLPGQYVTMQLVIGQRADALTIPRGAVSRMGGQARAWVARDGRAESREVTTGLENPERIEVLTGLAAGEQVVVHGHEGLYTGARVTDVARATPAAAGAPAQKGTPGKPASPAVPRDTDKPGMPGMRR